MVILAHFRFKLLHISTKTWSHKNIVQSFSRSSKSQEVMLYYAISYTKYRSKIDKLRPVLSKPKKV